MSVVSIAEAWPAPGKPFTVAELDRMPDDGHRYELLDGALLVSPRPNNSHQEVAAELLGPLRAACPAGLRALPEPAVQLSRDTEFAPDLVVIRQDQLTERRVTRPPLLTVEIQSSSSALFDLSTKKAVYERFSIPSYWVVVPDVDQPELIAFALRDGRYQQVAHVTGGKPFRAERPFPVEVVPARLVAGLLPG